MARDQIEDIELREIEEAEALTQKALQKEEERANNEKLKRLKLEEESLSYSSVKLIAKIFDDWFLDPIIGFFLPGIGDILTYALVVPYMYVALFKVQSVRLFLAVTFNATLDLLIGMIPGVGNIADIFIRANRKNYRLIVGFVEDDRKIKDEVNQMAITYLLLIFAMFGLIYLIIMTLSSIIGAIYNFFATLF